MTITAHGDWFDPIAYEKQLESNTARERVAAVKVLEYDEPINWYTEDEKLALIATARARVKYRTRYVTAPIRYIAALPSKYALK